MASQGSLRHPPACVCDEHRWRVKKGKRQEEKRIDRVTTTGYCGHCAQPGRTLDAKDASCDRLHDAPSRNVSWRFSPKCVSRICILGSPIPSLSNKLLHVMLGRLANPGDDCGRGGGGERWRLYRNHWISWPKLLSVACFHADHSRQSGWQDARFQWARSLSCRRSAAHASRATLASFRPEVGPGLGSVTAKIPVVQATHSCPPGL